MSENPNVTLPDGVPAVPALPIAAFLAQDPKVGELFLCMDAPYFVLRVDGDPLLMDASGDRWYLTELRGPIQRAQAVPADAIVLNQPTLHKIPADGDASSLKVLVGADVEIEHTGSDGVEVGIYLTPAMAREVAGLLALAADAVDSDLAAWDAPESARRVRRDRLADLADDGCERCEGSGLDPDEYTTSVNADGKTIHHLTEPCRDCIDRDEFEASSP